MKETIIGVLASAVLIILSCLPGAIAEPGIGELYKNAEDAYKNGYYLKAIDRYRAALIKSEQNIYEINKKVERLKDDAEEAYKDGKEADRNNNHAEAVRKYGEAAKKYEEALKASEEGSITEIEKLRKEAEAAKENKDYERAISKYREAFEKLLASFKMTEQSLENLTSEGLPSDVLEELQRLKNREFTGEENFLKNLEETIGDEQTNQFKPLILKHVEKLEAYPKFQENTEIQSLRDKAEEVDADINYSSEVERLRQEAERYHKKKDSEKAIEKYKRAFEIALPTDYEKIKSLGKEELSKAIGEYKKILEKLVGIVDANKKNRITKIKKLCKEAKTLEQNNDDQQAAEKYLEYIEEYKIFKYEIELSPDKSKRNCNEYKDALKRLQQSAAEATDDYKKALELSQKNRMTKVEKLRKDAKEDFKDENYDMAFHYFRGALDESRKRTATLHKDFNTLVLYKITLCYTNLADKVVDIERLRKEGKDAYSAENYSKSAKRYKKALEKSRQEVAENKKEIVKNNEDTKNLQKVLEKDIPEKSQEKVAESNKEITTNNEDAKSSRERAEEEYKEKKYQDAFDKYMDIIESLKWGLKTKKEKTQGEENPYTTFETDLSESLGKWAENKDFDSLALKHIEEIDKHSRESMPDEFQEGLAYLEAHIKFKKGDNTKFEEFIKKFPDSQFIPNALYATKKYDELLKRYPDSIASNEVRFLNAQQSFDDEKFDEASNDYEAFLNNPFRESSKVAEAQYRNFHCSLQSIFQKDTFDQKDLGVLLKDYNKFVGENNESDFLSAAYFDIANIYLLKLSKYAELETLNQEAEAAKENKDYEKAISKYKEAFTNLEEYQADEVDTDIDYPPEVEKLRQEAERYHKKEDSEKAIEKYKRAFEIALRTIKSQLFEKSLQNFELALQKSGSAKIYQNMRPRAKLGIAYIYYNKGSAAKAIANLPKDREFQDEEQLQSALSELRPKAKDQEELDEIYKLIKSANDTFASNKDYKLATTEYSNIWNNQNSKSLSPQEKLYIYFQEGLSAFYAAKKDPDGDKKSLLDTSVKAYQNAIQIGEANLQEDTDKCRFNLALAYAEQENTNEEVKNNYEAIDSDEYKETARLLYAQSFEKQDKAKAIQEYKAILEDAILEDAIISPEEENAARVNLAYLLYAVREYSEAATQFETIAQNTESKYADDAQYMAGICYLLNAEKEQAISALMKVIRDESGNIKTPISRHATDTLYRMANAYKDLEGWQKVLGVVTETRTLFPTPDNKMTENLTDLEIFANAKLVGAMGVEALIEKQREIISNSSDPIEQARAQLKIGHLRYKSWKDEETYIKEQVIQEYNNVNNYNSENSQEIAEFRRMARYQIALCYYRLAQLAKNNKEPSNMVRYYNDCIKEANWVLGKQRSTDINYLLGRVMFDMTYLLKENPNMDVNEIINNFDEKILKVNAEATNMKDTFSQASVRFFENAIVLEGANKRFTYDSHNRLVRLYLEQGKYEYAIKHCDAIINESQTENVYLSNKAEAYYYKGKCYKQSDDVPNAIQTFKDFLIYYNKTIITLSEERKQEVLSDNIKDMVVDGYFDFVVLTLQTGTAQELLQTLFDVFHITVPTEIEQIENLSNKLSDITGTRPYPQIQVWYTFGIIHSKRAEGSTETKRDEYLYAIPYYRKVIDYQNPPDKALVLILDSSLFAGQIYLQLSLDSEDANTKKDYWNDSKTTLETLIKDIEEGRYDDKVSKDKKEKRYQEALYTLAYHVYYLAGKYNDAAKTFEKLISEFPQGKDREEWYYYCGMSYFNLSYDEESKTYKDETKLSLALPKFDMVLNINIQYENAPDALKKMITCVDNIASNRLRNVIGQLKYIVNNYTELKLEDERKNVARKFFAREGNMYRQEIQSGTMIENILYKRNVLYKLDSEMVQLSKENTIFKNSENVPQSYIDLGIYYHNEGTLDKIQYEGASDDNKQPLFNSAISNHREAYTNYKTVYDLPGVELKTKAHGHIINVKVDMIGLDRHYANILLQSRNWEEAVPKLRDAISHCNDLKGYNVPKAKEMVKLVREDIELRKDTIPTNQRDDMISSINGDLK